jgi:hypothetical protein
MVSRKTGHLVPRGTKFPSSALTVQLRTLRSKLRQRRGQNLGERPSNPPLSSIIAYAVQIQQSVSIKATVIKITFIARMISNKFVDLT